MVRQVWWDSFDVFFVGQRFGQIRTENKIEITLNTGVYTQQVPHTIKLRVPPYILHARLIVNCRSLLRYR